MKRAISIIIVVCAGAFLLLLGLLVGYLWRIDSTGYVNLLGLSVRTWFATISLVLSIICYALAFRVAGSRRTRVSLILIIVLLFFSPFIPVYRHIWVRQMVEHLKTFKPSKDTPLAHSRTNRVGLITYLDVENELVHLHDGGWVYIVIHSTCLDAGNHYGSLRWIGDVCLSVDDEGNLYSSDEHPCAGMIINTGSTIGITNIQHFVQLNGWKMIKR